MPESIGMVDKELFDRVWKLATEIGVQERHFNRLQSGYRSMRSGWLLATFGGCGFAATQKFQIGIERELLLVAIAAVLILRLTENTAALERRLAEAHGESHGS